jgi:hypothetical protein
MAAAAAAVPTDKSLGKEEEADDPVATAVIKVCNTVIPTPAILNGIRMALAKRPRTIHLAFPTGWSNPAYSFLPAACVLYATVKWLSTSTGNVLLVARNAFDATRLLNRVDDALKELKWKVALRASNHLAYDRWPAVLNKPKQFVRAVSAAEITSAQLDGVNAIFALPYGTHANDLATRLHVECGNWMQFIAGPWPHEVIKPKCKLVVTPEAGAEAVWKEELATPAAAAAVAALKRRPRLTLSEAVEKLKSAAAANF